MNYAIILAGGRGVRFGNADIPKQFIEYTGMPMVVYSMQTAETLCNSIFGLLCPPKQYEKPVSVNGKLMLIKPAVLPTYKEKEKNGRHVFTFDLNFIHS